MPNKIKAFLVILVAVATFSVYAVFNYLKFSPFQHIGFLKSALLPAADQDPDHDGLTNQQESYWGTDPNNPDTDGDGYLDGEEVASGHDPRIPGPDDLLAGNKENLTDKVSNLVLGGLYAGSLNLNNSNYNSSIDQITSGILLQSSINTAITPPTINTVDDNSANIDSYRKNIKPILEDIRINDSQGMIDFLSLVQAIDISKNYNDSQFLSFFSKQTSLLDSQINSLESLEVPKKWSSNHQALLTELESVQTNYALFGKLGEDPIQASISLKNLVDSFSQNLPDILSVFYKQILQ